MDTLLGGIILSIIAFFSPAEHEPPPLPQLEQPVLQRPAMVSPAISRPAMLQPTPSHDTDLNINVPACDQYDPLFVSAAQRYAPWGKKAVWARWLKVQAFTESSCRPGVCSPADACGLMAFLPGTAKDMGITDRFDPKQSIAGGAKYMAWLYGQWRAHDREPVQRQKLALDSYNRGLGNTLEAQRKYGCVYWEPCFRQYAPEETRNYVIRISELVE